MTVSQSPVASRRCRGVCQERWSAIPPMMMSPRSTILGTSKVRSCGGGDDYVRTTRSNHQTNIDMTRIPFTTQQEKERNHRTFINGIINQLKKKVHVPIPPISSLGISPPNPKTSPNTAPPQRCYTIHIKKRLGQKQKLQNKISS